MTALKALNQNARGVDGDPCRYKGVNGVPLKNKRRWKHSRRYSKTK